MAENITLLCVTILKISIIFYTVLVSETPDIIFRWIGKYYPQCVIVNRPFHKIRLPPYRIIIQNVPLQERHCCWYITSESTRSTYWIDALNEK